MRAAASAASAGLCLDDRHARAFHRAARGLLVAHQTDGLGRRPDEGQPAFSAQLGESGVLGQQPVAGMDGLAAGGHGDFEDRADVQIAGRNRRGADAVALVGEADVHRFAVGLGIDRHRRDAHLLAGAYDPQRDLAAVGDEDFGKHGVSLLPISSAQRRTRPPCIRCRPRCRRPSQSRTGRPRAAACTRSRCARPASPAGGSGPC